MNNFIKRSIPVALVLLLVINVIFLSVPLNNVYADDLYENNYMDSLPDSKTTNSSSSPTTGTKSSQSAVESKTVNTNKILSTNKAEYSVNSSSTTGSAINLSEVLLPENAVISDSVINPLQPYLYAVDTANSKLYAINYETNTVTESSISLKPERIDYSNGKLYLTLLKSGHSSSIYDNQQTGAIAVIDASDLSLIKQIDINTDPFDVVVCGDNIYIPSGSGRDVYINSYSETTGKLISSASISQTSYTELNSTLNKIYTVDTKSSPRDLRAYEVNNGTFTRSYYSPNHGDYSLTGYLRISPDGKYIFNGSGNIFTSSSDKSKDMLYYKNLNKSFSDVAFDLENNKFYTAISGKLVYSYDYNTFNGISTFTSKGEIKTLYYKNNVLIALSKLDNNKFIVEKIDPSRDGESLPVNEVKTVQLLKSGDNFDLDYSINDSALDPSRNIVYITDSKNNKIASINYETGKAKELSTIYSPGSIAYYKDELYIGYGKQGKIEIYDAQTLELEDVLYTGEEFFDMNVGNDGYIYTLSYYYVKSYSRTSKQEVSALYLHESGYLEVHPTLNSLYMSSMNVSPTDLYVLNYNAGTLTRQYDSPYHGVYGITSKNRISPDGKYIFNSSSNVFTTSSDKSKDMLYYTALKNAFRDVAFDLENNKFYAAISGKLIYSYDYNTFNGIKTYISAGEIQNLYYRNNLLIALSRLNNKYIVEKIDPSGGENLPVVNEVKTVQISKNGNNFDLNYSINDSVIDPSRNIVYITDSANNKIASINYETGEAKELNTFYSPGSIAYCKDELYIGYGYQGKIEIYDAQNLTLKDVLYTGSTFFDFNVGNDGYIYTISDDFARSYSRTSKQEVSKLNTFHIGYLEVHPTLNSLYMTSVGVSVPRLYVIKYNTGILTDDYDSSFHADYPMTYNNRISPDGKYIFNGSGNIFTTSSDKSKDMIYYGTINKAFNDVAFDLDNNKFYTGVSGNIIYSYDYSTFNQLESYSSQGAVKRLYLQNGKLIAVSSSSNGKDIIEIIDTTNPIKQVTGISTNKTSTNIENGKTEQLTSIVLPENATNKNVVWSIQSGGYNASVSTTGLVTALKPGTAVVRVTSLADPTKYAECIITVVAAPAAQLTGFTWAKGSSLGTTRATVIPAGTLKYVVGAAKMQVRPKEGYPSTAYTNTLNANADVPVTAGQHIFIVSIYSDGTIKSWTDVAVDTANIKSAPIYGDLNDDGEINALDFALMKQYLLGNTTDINKKNADMNSDGVINAIDFALLKKQLLK